MGWCSATEIMDTALSAAEAVAVRATEMAAEVEEGTRGPDVNPLPELDEVLRPFVITIAEKLRDGDWDCIEESEYYDRFAQEMHGDTDTEYGTRLVEGLSDAAYADRPFWIAKLSKHYEKVGNADGAG